ncbi:MAG: asparagine synthetase B family protein [Bacteroidetes bacterium]|jgi:asparagine synthase (glutamine-hydrolysing)|nr:asparagine synthetase B family protein [Bacteroidota bacterium]
MPHIEKKLHDFVSLIDPSENQLLNMSNDEAEQLLTTGDPARVREIEGSFAIVHKSGQQVYMARSIGRPMRYFMAKQVSGPLLIVAERMDEIHHYLKEMGLDDQFRPDYTRMVPAHYLVRLDVIGCPDPNPQLNRYFEPNRNIMDADLDAIGEQYIEALNNECRKWVQTVPVDDPIGVMFSGGIDSGSVFLSLYHQMLELGMNPSRLKAFTLKVGDAADADQAFSFLDSLDLTVFLEVMEAEPSELDYKETIRVIEDYKQRDVEAATMGLTLLKKIRVAYPNWLWMADGDGGDENMKSYPIEDNPELTIRSVLNNPLLYHEGWGVDKIKHSLTYSGGQSRGHIRTYAPAKRYGFKGFSPYTLPNVIEVSEGIPFIQLTDWEHEQLYALKGDVVQRGIKAVTGFDMPVYPKRRFQHGAINEECFNDLFPKREMTYRNYFRSLYA